MPTTPLAPAMKMRSGSGGNRSVMDRSLPGRLPIDAPVGELKDVQQPERRGLALHRLGIDNSLIDGEVGAVEPSAAGDATQSQPTEGIGVERPRLVLGVPVMSARELVIDFFGARWAPTAGLLVGNLSHRFVEDTEWDYSEFSVYDLGQAVAHMSFQAQTLGLHVRQFRAFDRAALAAEFDVPQHWEITTMSAIGRVPADSAPDASADGPPLARHRRSSTEIHWPQATFTERRHRKTIGQRDAAHRLIGP